MADRSEQDNFYRVSRFLNQPRRVMGCTTDELLPAILFLIIGMCSSWLFTGLVVTTIWIFTIKYFKRKYGSAFLLVNLYWHTSAALSRNAFKKTPPSEFKHWMR